MNQGLFELFKISVGPSASHTFAPMKAGLHFIEELKYNDILHSIEQLTIEFFGSLALTGKIQNADIACVIGLMGISLQNIDKDQTNKLIAEIKKNKVLKLNSQRHILFDWEKCIIFHINHRLESYSNGLRISVVDEKGKLLKTETYYSTGGGSITDGHENSTDHLSLPFPFASMSELSQLCAEYDKSIAEIVFENEVARTGKDNSPTLYDKLFQQIDQLWLTVKSSIENGVQSHGYLPGGLQIERKAAYLHEMIKTKISQNQIIENDHWVNLFAMAASEENASGGTILSVPSNGAAGVIAAVLAYYNKFISNENAQGIRIFIATAAAIGSLYKTNHSLQAPHLGCQGEIGVACSMAAAGLTAAKHGTLKQIENAAQIGMEHNIGLTCDPTGGLVQAPCIERNCMGAVKAINASRLAMTAASYATVSFDQMLAAMYKSGLNMSTQYKETSLGDASKNHIPVNIVYC